MEHVLQYRVAVKSFLPATPIPSNYLFIAHDLLTYLDGFNIQEDINAISVGDEETKVFPVTELELLRDYLVNNKMMLNLVGALSVGRPLYFAGNFDCSGVSYMHLNDLVAVVSAYGKEHTVSSALIKLVEYTITIATMREALMKQGWQVEDKISKFKETDLSARITHKLPDIEILKAIYDSHEHYLELQKASKSDDDGGVGAIRMYMPLPPACVDEEMSLTIQQVNLIVQDCALCSAFTPGNLTLDVISNSLAIRDVSTSNLKNHVNKAKEVFPSVDSYRYNHLFISIESAKELIAIRKQLLGINETYTQHDNSCLFTCSNLEDILSSTYITEAINSAINNVSSLLQYNTTGRFRFMDEWEPVSNLLLNSNYLLAFNTTEEETDILLSETFSRIFTSKVLSSLWSIDRHFTEYFELLGHRNSSETNVAVKSKLIDKCTGHLQQLNDVCHYYQFCMETVSVSSKDATAVIFTSTLSARAKNWIRKNPMLVLLYNSCVYLTHVLKALRVSNYDGDILRDWKVDQYGLKGTPTISVLDETKDDKGSSKHTMQAIARSYLHYNELLHPILHKVMNVVIQDMDDEVTFDELTAGLSEGQATGDVGALTGLDTTKLQHAMDRVTDSSNPVSIVNKETLLLYQSCEFLLQLRTCTVNQLYHEGIDLMLRYFFPSGDRTILGLGKHVYKGVYDNIHSLPSVEIVKLCINMLDSYWQLEANRLLSTTNSSIGGTIGTFDLSLIDYESLEYCFEYLHGHLELSPKTDRMKDTVYLMRRLRHTTAATRVLLNKYSNRAASVPDYVIDLSLVPDTITQLGMNPHWASTFSLILNLSQSILQSAGISDFNTDTVSCVSKECELSSQYSEYMIAGIQLEVCLNIQSVYFNEASGLQLIKLLVLEMNNAVVHAENAGIGSPLASATACTSLDVWWTQLLQLGRHILSLQHLIQVGYNPPTDDEAAHVECFHIHPGTDMFLSILATIDAIVDTITVLQGDDSVLAEDSLLRTSLINILQEDATRVDGRLFTISNSVLSMKTALLDCKQEHESMVLLHDIMNADLVSLEIKTMDFSLVIVDGPSHAVTTEAVDHVDKFSKYTVQSLSKVVGFTLVSEAGKLLQQLVTYHLMLRDSVYRKDVSAAHSIALQIRGMDVLSTRNEDAELVLQYCRMLSVQRSIEKGMLHCVVPTIVGWSRLAEGKLFTYCVNDTVLEEAIEECHTSHMDLIAEYPVLEHLYKCGIALLNLTHAMRGGKWDNNNVNQADTPEYDAVTQLLALHPDSKVPVAAVVASTHLVSGNKSIEGLCDTLGVEDALAAFDEYINDALPGITDVLELLETGVPLLPFIKRYLNALSLSIRNEVAASKLVKEVDTVLQDVSLGGYPGHVLIPTGLYDRVSNLVALLDKHQEIVSLDYYLFSCYHSSKVLLALLSSMNSGGSGDALTYVTSFIGLTSGNYPLKEVLEFMLYMSTKPDYRVAMATICHQSMEVTWQCNESLFALSKSDYSQLFEVISSKFTSNKAKFDDTLLEQAHQALALCTSRERDRIPTHSKLSRGILLCDLHDVTKLHTNFVAIYTLLANHVCFVDQFQAFHALTYSVPLHYTRNETGATEYNQALIPGEINTEYVEYNGLIEIHHMLRSRGLATYLGTYSLTHWLTHSLAYLLTHSLTHLLTHPTTFTPHSLTHLPTNLLTHLLTLTHAQTSNPILLLQRVLSCRRRR
jgi:hypothetical protein